MLGAAAAELAAESSTETADGNDATPAAIDTTLASLEGSPGPAAALARPTGGLMLIDAFTLVGLAGKYTSRSGAARLLEAEPPVL